MKKITLSFNVLAAIIAVTILQACAVGPATQCATPTLTPQRADAKTGTIIQVKIETATPGAQLLYTLDGTTPTDGSSPHGTLIPAQSGTIAVRVPDVFGRTLRVEAIAFKPGLTDSPVAEGEYKASSH